MVESGNSAMSIQRQCELLGLSRSGYYYQSQGESPQNIKLMHRIDALFTKYPFYGVDKITAHLSRQGPTVNGKRIRRLMRKMGLEAVYPKPNLSQRHPALGYIHICYVSCGSSAPIRSGVRTSHTFGWPVVLSIWWRSWTGSVGMC